MLMLRSQIQDLKSQFHNLDFSTTNFDAALFPSALQILVLQAI